MSAERLLQITVATLAALATLLLEMGQRSVVLPALVAVAAFVSVWLTDVKGWLRLSRLPSGLLASAALLFCLRSLFPLHHATTILEIAHLLVYLQVILLFQQKTTRIYWQLLVLSLLQVVVATVFNQGVWFGMLLVVYLFTALLALMLFCMVREQGRCRAVVGSCMGDEPAVGRKSGKSTWYSRMCDCARIIGCIGANKTVRGAGETTTAAQAVTIELSKATATGLPAVALPGRELFLRVVLLGLGTLLFTAAAFFVLPRLGRTAWRGQTVQTRRWVGYADTIALGELGAIIESPQEVMRVQFVDPANGQCVPVGGDIYLHGAALTDYSGGHWSRSFGQDWPLALRPLHHPPQKGVVRQMITIEPMDRCELFYVRPFSITKANPRLQLYSMDERLCRLQRYMNRRFTFSLQTTALADGRQTAYVPVERPPPLSELLQMPQADSPDGLPHLAALAEQWLDAAQLPRADWQAAARLLRRRLADGERFHYSLAGQPRDERLDPVEDFIVNNPSGHCEYFATALSLMLRSQGIPARMIVGYKCDEFNRLGGFFQVRQLHAHAWVEVYLPREKLPPAVQDEAAAGAWMRLDPTPAGNSHAARREWLAPLAGAWDWLQFAWGNYVMEMDRSRQQKAIYQPLVNWSKIVWQKLSDPQWWRRLRDRVIYMLNPRHWHLSQWFSWRGGLAGMAVCAVLVLAFKGCRLLYRAVRERLTVGRRRRRAARVEVAFYRRLNAILARWGLRKTDAQTPREFARRAADRLAAEPETRDLARLPEMIVDAFYLVRFGRLLLDKNAQAAVEQALAKLDQAGRPH